MEMCLPSRRGYTIAALEYATKRNPCQYGIKVKCRELKPLGNVSRWWVEVYAIPESSIRRNVTGIRCGNCGSDIVSLSRHDFRSCKCKACYIDGGFDYSRVGWTPGIPCKHTSCVVDMKTGSILAAETLGTIEQRAQTTEEITE